MRFLILLSTSGRALRKHKIRSFLTVLGIMIGIAAITITFSIGRGAEEAITAQILSMGENSIYIIPSSFIKHGALRGSVRSAKLHQRDIVAIKAQSPEIREITPMHMTAQVIEYIGKKASQNIVGCTSNMPEIDDGKIAAGSFFNDYHMRHKSNVIVLGSTPAEELFGKVDPVGKVVLVNRQPFKVIGVMEAKPHYFGPRDPNERAFIPYTTSKKLFMMPGESEDELTAIAIRLYDYENSIQFLRKLKRVLRFTHATRADEEDPFVVFDTQTIEQVARDASAILKLFGLIAASISLIVGSIGVMNIMLVSVKERTREIGLRMALGATQRAIQWQFLLESTTLSVVGGLIGVGIGLFGQFAIGYGTNLSPVIELTPMIVSLIVTALIGIFFGYYPARQASLLNPVDALLDR